MTSVQEIRKEYTLATLSKKDVDANPFRQFEKWFNEALAAEVPEPHAMGLASADEEGKPSARMVFVRGFDERGFVFYTNYESRKGRELAQNPNAALVFYWTELERQIRIEGVVSKVSSDEGYDELMRFPRNTLGEHLAKMLKGGVIMDVMNVEQAQVAEKAGAVAVMALERLPVDIRSQGGVARMSDPLLIRQIQEAVSVPVMAKVRIGHTAEARILEALEVDFVDESEVLTPADPFEHIEKTAFNLPFVCGATTLGEALRRISEGAAMIRTKGEAGTGNVIEAVRHLKLIKRELAELQKKDEKGLSAYAEQERVTLDLVKDVRSEQRLPVVTFVAGGIATPSDAALLMGLGAEGVFVGSGIFKSSDPPRLASAIVRATTHYQDAKVLAQVSEGLGDLMPGLDMVQLGTKMQERGW